MTRTCCQGIRLSCSGQCTAAGNGRLLQERAACRSEQQIRGVCCSARLPARSASRPATDIAAGPPLMQLACQCRFPWHADRQLLWLHISRRPNCVGAVVPQSHRRPLYLRGVSRPGAGCCCWLLLLAAAAGCWLLLLATGCQRCSLTPCHCWVSGTVEPEPAPCPFPPPAEQTTTLAVAMGRARLFPWLCRYLLAFTTLLQSPLTPPPLPPPPDLLSALD